MRRVKGLLVIAACLCFGGCAAVALFALGAGAGVAGYSWYKGSLKVEYEAPFTEVYDACVKTLEKRGMELTTQEHKMNKGWVFAKQADGTELQLTLKYISAKRTEVDIRVGTFGDKEESSAIAEAIRTELFKK
jgi:hypothetical protein